MSDRRKRILSPFTGCKKRKGWNKKTKFKKKDKIQPVKRGQNLAETDRGYYREELLEEFLDGKGAFYNRNESDNDNASYNEHNEQQQLQEGSASRCNEIVSPVLLQKLINVFAVCKHQKQCSGTLLLAENVIHGFGNQIYIFQKEPHFLIDQPRSCCIYMLYKHYSTLYL